jgi:hypothetical protein
MHPRGFYSNLKKNIVPFSVPHLRGWKAWEDEKNRFKIEKSQKKSSKEKLFIYQNQITRCVYLNRNLNLLGFK